jgi:hypothetical protein
MPMKIRAVLHTLALLAVCAPASYAGAEVPTPDVIGPITSPGGAFLTPPIAFDLAAQGYVEEEFFLDGTATAFTSPTSLGSDGRWTAVPGATAPYVTRILVRRPASRKHFNGAAVVEWLNVSGGLDASPDWTYVHTLVMRHGFAWVGVSAQFQGVQGTGGPLGLNLSLKAVDPVRYGPLSHPGDSFSYDMFSQVAQALTKPTDVRPLGDLQPRRLIAIGESQSAFRLTTYVNAIHPLAQLYDGFLIHSRGGGSAALSQSPQPAVGTPNPVFIREDVEVPVLTVETETDLISLGFLPARQPDTDRIRLWEIAGTAHSDVYQFGPGPGDPGPGAADVTHLPPQTSVFGVINCSSPLNQGPHQYVLNAALWRLDRWVRRGRARGKSAPLLEIVPGPAIARDALGNALGGIRTPPVDVPVSTLSGLGQTGSTFCALFGTTVAFDDALLASLYPTHDDYVRKVRRAASDAVREGYMRKIDAKVMLEAAMDSDVGG